VIPLIAGLLGAGVPLAPVMAFWVSSPLMSPESFILTSAVIGLDFATARLITAVGLGLVAGFATHGLARRGLFDDILKPISGCGSCCGGGAAFDGSKVHWRFWEESARRAAFMTEARGVTTFLLRWLTLAFLLESLLVAYIPGETVASWLGNDNFWAIPSAVLVGIPAYLNGFAAIPMLDAMIDLGMSKGAALSFIAAGAVTSIPAALSVYALVRLPVFIWYIALGTVGSLTAGIAYQLFLVA
jgi:uncharacterized membrane protein YraQ (UPF0718 family)